MYSSTKHKGRKHYCMHCLQNFTTEEILDKHKKRCLLINGTQAVNYESEIIKLKNYEKQVPIVSKIYADTECFLKRSNSFEGEYTIKYQERFPNSIGVKLVCIIIDLLYQLLFLKEKNVLMNLLNGILDKKNGLIK